jgi:hypothetical protein
LTKLDAQLSIEEDLLQTQELRLLEDETRIRLN